jgi:hypothetical protein
MGQDFEAFVPKEVTVSVNGEPVTVRPLTMGKIPAFIKAVEPIKGVLSFVEGEPLDLTDLLVDPDKNAALLNSLTISTGIATGTLEALTPDTVIELATAVLEVNADFFARRLAPLWRTSLTRVVEAFAKPATATPTPSSSLPEPDSATGEP